MGGRVGAERDLCGIAMAFGAADMQLFGDVANRAVSRALGGDGRTSRGISRGTVLCGEESYWFGCRVVDDILRRGGMLPCPSYTARGGHRQARQ